MRYEAEIVAGPQGAHPFLAGEVMRILLDDDLPTLALAATRYVGRWPFGATRITYSQTLCGGSGSVRVWASPWDVREARCIGCEECQGPA